jgi:hypothetical protein
MMVSCHAWVTLMMMVMLPLLPMTAVPLMMLTMAAMVAAMMTMIERQYAKESRERLSERPDLRIYLLAAIASVFKSAYTFCSFNHVGSWLRCDPEWL